ncbi:MAG: hypothetical protein L6Q71_01840 [Planctomycetes bacterium]|nr:hypothetical protein [Planctomycetota bacterium]NUQ34378.1 hypothetical protein [Planctomycetaceae bacterium]
MSDAASNVDLRDKFVATLKPLERRLRMRQAWRASIRAMLVASFGSAVALTVLALVPVLLPGEIEAPMVDDVAMAAILMLPLAAFVATWFVVFSLREKPETVARWADVLSGGDAISTALTVEGSFRGPLRTRAEAAVQELGTARLPYLDIGRNLLGVVMLASVMAGASAFVWMTAPPPSVNVEDTRLIRLDPMETVAGALGGVQPLADAARGLGLTDMAAAFAGANQLAGLLERGGLSQGQALAELGRIEDLLGRDQGLAVLGQALANPEIRKTIEELRGKEGTRPDPATLMRIASAIAPALGKDGMPSMDQLGKMLERSELAQALLQGKASANDMATMLEAREQLIERSAAIREVILERERAQERLEFVSGKPRVKAPDVAGKGSTSSSPDTTVKVETTGRDLTAKADDERAGFDRLPPEFRDAAEEYLSGRK